MSPNTSPGKKDNDIIQTSDAPVHEKWIEIVEPKSKQRIYANLETGFCAKQPPEGSEISRAEDFSDHWWELYDEKSGKFYYYNPDQQRTVWTRPQDITGSNGNGRGVLVIPVSRLQTFKKLSPIDKIVDRCDVATQTLASNLVSTSTQTNRDCLLDDEFGTKLRLTSSNNNTDSSSSSTHVSDHRDNGPNKFFNHRQSSDIVGRDEKITYQKHHQRQSPERNQLKQEGKSRVQEAPRLMNQRSIETTTESKHTSHSDRGIDPAEKDGKFITYFGPPVKSEKSQVEMDTRSCSTTKSVYITGRPDEYSTSTSTFVNSSLPPPIPITNHQEVKQQSRPTKPPRTNLQKEKQHQTLTTNNLSHYLVREARAMGIALISDDEDNDEDQDSDEDCVVDDDEDTDLRDNSSKNRTTSRDLNASIDLGDESSEGWKSFSDQGSPNGQKRSSSGLMKSPLICETSNSPFIHEKLIDEEKDPASCLSQQLDHRKLVENFKKTRQTSSFGLHDSMGRSYMLDANNAVQRIKHVADTYFHHNEKSSTPNDPIRQVNPLFTLPRPHRDLKQPHLQQMQMGDLTNNIDADYDTVEENCTGYFHPSDYLSAKQTSVRTINSSFDNSSSKLSIGNVNLDNSTQANHFDRNKSSRGSTFSVESFARENLTRHPKKGGLIFNRKVKWSRMISWTKRSIRQPMISSVGSDLNSEAVNAFKLIQQYMGDRKVNMNKRYRVILADSIADESEEPMKTNKSSSKQSSNLLSNSTQPSGSTAQNSNFPSIPERLRDEIAFDLVAIGCTHSSLRDELFVQLTRQLTDNPSTESASWGLILMSILFAYFSPSTKFAPFLLSFLEGHNQPMAVEVCLPRLEKRLRQSSLTYCRKPADGKEISIVRLSITKWPQYCGVFGECLEALMVRQACSAYLKRLRLPWILTTLGDKLLETGGAATEGIFRCAADHDLIAQLRLEIDCVDFRKINDSKQVHSLLANVQDPHVIAGLLKLFFRQLREPVFPEHLYEACLEAASTSNHHAEQNGFMACRIFEEELPNLNKDVVAYLIRLLQYLARPEQVNRTKMDDSNLSMVWAPNLVRSPDQQSANFFGASFLSGSTKNVSAQPESDHQSTDTIGSHCMASQSQTSIFEQTRQEMQFIRSLIIHLDTSFVENVV